MRDHPDVQQAIAHVFERAQAAENRAAYSRPCRQTPSAICRWAARSSRCAPTWACSERGARRPETFHAEVTGQYAFHSSGERHAESRFHRTRDHGQAHGRQSSQEQVALAAFTRSGVPAELTQAGVVACDSPAAVAAQADVIFIMVPDTPDVERVLFGENGLVAGLRDGQVVVDMSSISPIATREFATKVRRKAPTIWTRRSRAAKSARRPRRSRSWWAARKPRLIA